jgi:hypothetical protein
MGLKIDKTSIASLIRERANRPFPCPYSILLMSIPDRPEFAELNEADILASFAFMDEPVETFGVNDAKD